MGQNFDELVEKTIIDVENNKECAFDVGGLALMNNEKKNAEAVASYLLGAGLYEQYNGVLKNCKLLSIENEIKRVKKDNKPSAYLAILEFLQGEDYEFAKNIIFRDGSDYDKIRFILFDNKSSKVELFNKVYNSASGNALGFLIKYLSDDDFVSIVRSPNYLSFVFYLVKSKCSFAINEVEKKRKKIIKKMSLPDLEDDEFDRCR